jgi:hypothetical protein
MKRQHHVAEAVRALAITLLLAAAVAAVWGAEGFVRWIWRAAGGT